MLYFYSFQTCKRVMMVSYTYDYSYDKVAKLKSCGEAVGQAIVKNLTDLVVGKCDTSASKSIKFSSKMVCPSGYVSNKADATTVKLCGETIDCFICKVLSSAVKFIALPDGNLKFC